MIEKIKNFALVKVYPLSLFFLTFCGSQNKEHKIPYEQMPLEVREDASDAKKNWIANYKKSYNPELIRSVIQEKLKFELKASLEGSDSSLIQENQGKALTSRSGSETFDFSQKLQKKLKRSNLSTLKESLEAFIQIDLDKAGDPLKYSSTPTSLLEPLLSKSAHPRNYTQLLAAVSALNFDRADLRHLRAVLIYTPENMTLGYTLKDSEQSWLLVGLPNAALGSKVKYFGPTSQLTGAIAIIDLELAFILDFVKDSISNLDTARAFALDHSAKRHHYSLQNLSPTFKDNSSLAFDVKATESSPVFESEDLRTQNGAAYPASEITYVFESSALDNEALQASYKQHLDNLARQEELRHQEEERARLGSNYQNEGPWPYKFGGLQKIKRLITTLTLNKEEAPSFVLDQLARERECWVENPTVNPKLNKDFLMSWGIGGENRAWKFEKLKEDDLGLCRTTRDLGYDMSFKFLSAHTRILQPLYIGFPKKVLRAGGLKGTALFERQKTLSEEISSQFCAEIQMKSTRSASNEAAQHLETMGQELFHNETVSPENSFENFEDYNFFSLRCYSVGKKIEAAAPADTKEPKRRSTQRKAYLPGTNTPAPQRGNFTSPSRVR